MPGLRIHCCICNRETSYELFSRADNGTPRFCKWCQLGVGNTQFGKREENKREEDELYSQDIKDYFEFKIDNYA